MKSGNGQYKYYCLNYCRKNNYLDKFLDLYIDRKKFDKLWSICKPTLTLSHRQAAAVERGFRVNKKILMDNLQQKSLISQSIVYDYMTVKHASSLHEYNIPNSLLLKWKGSQTKYVNF